MPIAESIGLGAAVDWLSGIGMDAVREHGRDVTAYALERLAEVDGLKIHGTPTSTPAARSSASRSRASTRTTWPRSSAARASASAPVTTARSR